MDKYQCTIKSLVNLNVTIMTNKQLIFSNIKNWKQKSCGEDAQFDDIEQKIINLFRVKAS